MQRLIQIEEKIRCYDAVCELLKRSEVLLPGTRFYLVRLREALGNEIAELEHEEDERLAA